jgi:tetratricopeptide (TPR) repeat protein
MIMLKTNPFIVGLLMLSCLSTVAAEAAIINPNLNNNPEGFLLAQLTPAGRQQDAFARDSNTLYNQVHGAEILRRNAEFARQQAEIARQNQIQGWRDSIPALERERNYLALSKTLYWLEDLDKALDSANRAIQSEPIAARAHWLRGDINVKLRNIKGALIDYNRAIAIEPDFHPYYVSRSLLKKGFDRGGAIQDIRMAIKLVSIDNRFNLIRDSEVASLLKELRSMGVTQ